MAQEKSWIDHVMALVLPVVVSVGGLAYTIHKDQVDEKVRNEIRRADIERQEWDRDTAYVRLLTSSNPDEKICVRKYYQGKGQKRACHRECRTYAFA